MKYANSRRQFNSYKFIHNIIAPVQITIGLLLLFGTVGAYETDHIGILQLAIQTIAAIVLMAGTALYKNFK